jgi:hypothetical protein
MNHQRGLFAALLLLTTALACVLPGQPSASSPPPTPDTRLGTMVAETVSAALEMTQQAVPTPTIPPTSTPEPTATPTSEIVDSSGSTLSMEEDGTIIFTDERAGYRLEVLPAWLAMRVNQQEYLDAWLLPIASNPAFQRSLGSVQDQDPERFRLFLFDESEEHIDGGFVTNVNFLWNEQEVSLEDETDLMALADALPDSLPGSEVLTVEIRPLENGTKIGIVTSRLEAVTLDDVAVVLFQKQVFIDLPVGTLAITLSTTETWRETVEPSFDAMLETFTLVN